MDTYKYMSIYTRDIFTIITFRYIQYYLYLYLGILTNK